jgi:nucleoside-diphosphate-sugar epimerase
MIVFFGASSDIGLRASRRLLDDGIPVRLVARDPAPLDPRAQRVPGNISGTATIAADADVVVSCAHTRFTKRLLDALPARVRYVVLIGSAWRYSQIPSASASEVRSAEVAFFASGHRGVMLHPTMIYGGAQERNLRLLLTAIRRWPVLPLPDGRRRLVQPVHVDDVAACIVAAARRAWSGASAIPIAGPEPMPWREMVRACMRALQRRRLLVPVPLGLAIRILDLIQLAGLKSPIDADVLRRFREDVILPTDAMRTELGVTPRAFEVGLAQTLAEWCA